MSSKPTLEQLLGAVRCFNREREWEQFHTPRNLASGLVLEAAEVLELFQWDIGEGRALVEGDRRARLADELGDILIYLVNLADKAEIDLLQASFEKLEKNAMKYPTERVRGSARKYNEY